MNLQNPDGATGRRHVLGVVGSDRPVSEFARAAVATLREGRRASRESTHPCDRT